MTKTLPQWHTPFDVLCPDCTAQTGHACLPGGVPRDWHDGSRFHPARVDAAFAANHNKEGA